MSFHAASDAYPMCMRGKSARHPLTGSLNFKDEPHNERSDNISYDFGSLINILVECKFFVMATEKSHGLYPNYVHRH